MRTRFLLLLAVASAACAESPPPPDPRQPVTLYLRPGEFVRAEYVDSALMTSPNRELEARTRALDLWREYGATGLDSIVVHVSDRAEAVMDGASKGTSIFHFTNADVGGATHPAPPAHHARPVALEIHPGDYIRAEYVDSALVEAAQFRGGDDQLVRLARQVWWQHGPALDSVIIQVRNHAPPPAPNDSRDPETTLHRTYKARDLQDD